MFSHPEAEEHELVQYVHDPSCGLRAIIALHSTVAGPAFGGCRMWPYASEAEALSDALRLSRGMTLEAGDLVAARTPEGVGMGRTPPEYLQDGDVLETEVEGIGLLRNRIVG